MSDTQETVATEGNRSKSDRNYQLDFLKLFFAVLVFVFHARVFGNESERPSLPIAMGAISVHFFFIVSGLLMANSIIRKRTQENINNPGKSAISFVLNKYKAIAWPINVSFIFCFITEIIVPGSPVMPELLKIFPELFLVSWSGVSIYYNSVVWYISAMFIIMLPLAYLIYKKSDLTLHVLCPIIAVLSLGYMAQQEDFNLLGTLQWNGLLLGGIVRALCGVCFGVCAYNIYICICNKNPNRNARIFLTIIEVLLYACFFTAWFGYRDRQSIMSVLFVLPIAVAITFSQKSYLRYLFQFKWMKVFEPLSLYIYLNQYTAREIVDHFFNEKSWRDCFLLMILFTIYLCIISFLLVQGGKKIWSKWLKTAFTKPDKKP